jgi:hypothetical protein
MNFEVSFRVSRCREEFLYFQNTLRKSSSALTCAMILLKIESESKGVQHQEILSYSCVSGLVYIDRQVLYPL